MAQGVKADDLDAWAAADERFHRHLIELCGNRLLIDAVQNCWDRAHRARMVTLRMRPKPVNSTREHIDVVEQIRARRCARRVRVPSRASRARQPRAARDPRALPTAAAVTSDAMNAPNALHDRRAARRRHRRRGDRRRRCRCSSKLQRTAPASRFAFEPHAGGAQHYTKTGDALPEATLEGARARRRDPVRRDGLAGDPLSRRHRDRAAARPARRARALCRRAPGRARFPASRCRSPIRARGRSTSSSCASRPRAVRLARTRRRGRRRREARDTMVITRTGSRARARLRVPPRAAAQARAAEQGRVTCVDKANVFRSMAFFRHIFDERRAAPSRRSRPTITTSTPPRSTSCASPGTSTCRHREHVRRHPLRPDRGARRRHGHGAFGRHRRRPRRCSSPATARRPTSPGRGKANPTATILSAAMMLDWLAERTAIDALRRRRARLEARGRRVFAERTVRHVRVRRQRRHAAIADGGDRRERCDAMTRCASPASAPATSASSISQAGARSPRWSCGLVRRATRRRRAACAERFGIARDVHRRRARCSTQSRPISSTSSRRRRRIARWSARGRARAIADDLPEGARADL